MLKFLATLAVVGLIAQPSWSLTQGLFPRRSDIIRPGVAVPHQQNLDETKVPTFEEAMAAYKKSSKRELTLESLKTKKGLKGGHSGYQHNIKEVRALFDESEGSTPGPTYLPVLLNMPDEQVQQTEMPETTTIGQVQETVQVQETTTEMQTTQAPEVTTQPATTTEIVQVQQTEEPVQVTTVDEFAGYDLGAKGGQQLTGPVGTKGSKKRNVHGKGGFHKTKWPEATKKVDPSIPLLPSLRG